jgi:nicotinate phosphoribosyltransferase
VDIENRLTQLYRENLSALTDLYQLTMAYGAWKNGRSNQEGVFDLYFRQHPFEGGYAIHAGLEAVLDFIENFHFDSDQCEYIRSLKGSDGKALFEPAFVDFLSELRLTIDVEAIEEGRVVFAGEPLYRLHGPILQCQLLETPLLNLVNFATLVATKASRVKQAAGTDSVLEFGLRRAQGVDGSLTASRSSYLAGGDATSNVLAGKVFGIPVRGTHAHSWIMSFESELEAFMKYAEAMPNNCIFLVDTYDTLQGVRHAIQAGLWLKSKGHKMLGIRLDSGDLAYLSIEARKLMDAAGFKDAIIVASNDLDENLIMSLKQQGAKIDTWAVGTKLVTAFDQPALGGVFKLVAMKEESGEYRDRIKLSEQIAKVTNPGIHQVRRFFDAGLMVGDMIYDIRSPLANEAVLVDPKDPLRRKKISATTEFIDLLVPMVRKGKVIYARPSLEEIKQRCTKEISQLHPSSRRFANPHAYVVGLEEGLHHRKTDMILKLRNFANEAT